MENRSSSRGPWEFKARAAQKKQKQQKGFWVWCLLIELEGSLGPTPNGWTTRGNVLRWWVQFFRGPGLYKRAPEPLNGSMDHTVFHVSPPFRVYVEARTPSRGGVWRWGLWEVESLQWSPWHEMSALVRRDTRTSSLCAVERHSEKVAFYKPELDSRNRSKFLLFEPLITFCYVSRNGLRHMDE